MNEDFATARLSGGGLRRRTRVAPKYQKDGYAAAFDARTLWMDAVWNDGEVTLVCPRLNNLASLVRQGTFTLDGLAKPAKVRTFYRHSLIRLKSAQPPERVAFMSGTFDLATRVHSADKERFRGRNVIVTMSRDNDLVWIEDFARFHAETQGAEGIVFIDNGSSDYGPDEIRYVLDRTGLDALVMSTELPFGPRGRSPYSNTELFLQTCALNAVRLRYLRHARAVLCCDIDELVLGQAGTTVFDATWRSRFGLTRFGGEWRYARLPTAGAIVRHEDHAFLVTKKDACPAKWCVRPDGPLGDLQWRPHILEGFAFNWAFRSKAFTYHHCRQITTGWKRNAVTPEVGSLVPTKTAWQLVGETARAVHVGRAGRPAARASGMVRTVRCAVESGSRRFFGLRPALKAASLAFATFLGLAAEEAIDNDPVSQEISYLMQGFQD